jgi:hypothetical protein
MSSVITKPPPDEGGQFFMSSGDKRSRFVVTIASVCAHRPLNKPETTVFAVALRTLDQ